MLKGMPETGFNAVECVLNLLSDKAQVFFQVVIVVFCRAESLMVG